MKSFFGFIIQNKEKKSISLIWRVNSKMEDKIEKFKKLVVEGDFTSIKEKYPSKLMDKAYTYIGKK